MNEILKFLLIIGYLILITLVTIYGFYKPLKGDTQPTLGKIIAIYIFLLIVVAFEVAVLFILLGL
jgi:hypothetical protein